MKYFKLIWAHNVATDPVVIFYEVNADGKKLRIVEVRADGEMGYASATDANNMPAITPDINLGSFYTEIQDLERDSQTHLFEIDQEAFQKAWKRALMSDRFT